MADFYQVAKAIITIEFDTTAHYLMSIKRDPGSRNEGKLEFLGGRLEPSEAPKHALLRELLEEEASGELSRLAAQRVNLFFTVTTAGAEHFLFPFQLHAIEFELLAHHPLESFGFELIHSQDLTPADPGFTYKTTAIIEAMNGAPLHLSAG